MMRAAPRRVDEYGYVGGWFITWLEGTVACGRFVPVPIVQRPRLYRMICASENSTARRVRAPSISFLAVPKQIVIEVSIPDRARALSLPSVEHIFGVPAGISISDWTRTLSLQWIVNSWRARHKRNVARTWRP